MPIDEQKFEEYIQQREDTKKHLDKMNAKYRDVRMTFGKYKGIKLYELAQKHDRYYNYPGQEYLQWVSKNVDIEDELLNEAVEFYKDYYYPKGDGYD